MERCRMLLSTGWILFWREVNFTVCIEKEQDHENVRTMKRVGMCKNRCWLGLAFGIWHRVSRSVPAAGTPLLPVLPGLFL